MTLPRALLLALAAIMIAAAVAALLAGAFGSTAGGLGLPLMAAVCGGAGYAAGQGLLARRRTGLAAGIGLLMMAGAIVLALWAMLDRDPWRGFVVYAVMLASLTPAMVGLAIAAWRHLHTPRA